MIDDWSTCALCPRLCRPACPVTTGSRREAAVPAVIAAAILEWERGDLSAELAAQAATLCTDCGACQDWCLIDRPLPRLLREVRPRLLPEPLIEPLRPIEGEGSRVAVEADDRAFARALSRRLDAPVRRWVTRDHLGVAAVEHPSWPARARALRAHVGEAEVVVADGGSARALEAAGVPFRWLHEVVPGLPGGVGSCAVAGEPRPLRCCGAGGPLPRHHPEDARRVGRAWLDRTRSRTLLDARCRAHLRASGGDVVDLLDVLLSEGT